MNRLEFMDRLAVILKDVPTEEKAEAIQFYNNYFDDAGEENEQQVIEELESPEKVAAMIKDGLKDGVEGSNGYTPASRTASYNNAGSGTEKLERNNKIMKIALIVLIACVASPVWVPIAFGLICAAIGITFGIIGLFAGIVIGGFAVGVAGLVIFVTGLWKIISFPPTGLFVSGCGLMLFVIGMVIFVLGVKLCMIIYPAMFRGIVNFFRKFIHKKEGAR